MMKSPILKRLKLELLTVEIIFKKGKKDEFTVFIYSPDNRSSAKPRLCARKEAHAFGYGNGYNPFRHALY
jgi:hypothetical protein